MRENTESVKAEEDSKSLNFIDANKLLSILVGLEDQLHQIFNQSESLSAAASQVLTQKDVSRAHTALGRLTSLMTLPSNPSVSPLTLAEHGVCNVSDQSLAGGLRFYQQLQVDLEDIQ